MKYWLLIIVLQGNGDFAGKALQGPFVNKPACEAMQRITSNVSGDPKVIARCYTDDHMQGRTIDPGPQIKF